MLKNFSTTTKHTGIRKIPNSVLKVMPATTALPMDTRAPAPGPVATASGRQPRMNANEVIRDGRSQRRDATTAATTQATVATTAATQSQNTTTAAMDNTFIFSDSNSRKLTKEEVLRLSAWDTKLAKNEIYARHNRKFDIQKIQAYFDSQQWYHGTVAPSDFDEDVFNEYEKANVELLKKAEDGTLTASTSSGTSSTDDGYIISDSSIRELTDSDLS